jgi:hypothetical protein
MSNALIVLKEVDSVIPWIVHCSLDKGCGPTAGPSTPGIPDLPGISRVRSPAIGMPNIFITMEDVKPIVSWIVECRVDPYC